MPYFFRSSLGPQSILQSVIQSSSSRQQQQQHYSVAQQQQQRQQHTPYQSLPYISSSNSTMNDSVNPNNKTNPKTARTCELEEYARRYEATSRNRKASRNANANDVTPVNFWQQHKRTSLQQQQQQQQQENGGVSSVWSRTTPEDATTGRDSVMTNSSNETVRVSEYSARKHSLQPYHTYSHHQQQHLQQQADCQIYQNAGDFVSLQQPELPVADSLPVENPSHPDHNEAAGYEQYNQEMKHQDQVCRQGVQGFLGTRDIQCHGSE